MTTVYLSFVSSSWHRAPKTVGICRINECLSMLMRGLVGGGSQIASGWELVARKVDR